MQAENGVEWDLVDYGAGVFHVAFYQDRPAAEAAPLEIVTPLETPLEAQDTQVPECFFLRCWTAFRDGCRAA